MPRRNYQHKPLKHQPFQLAGEQNCQAKKAFLTEHEARQAVNYIQQLNPEAQLDVYYCPTCQKYHLTTHH